MIIKYYGKPDRDNNGKVYGDTLIFRFWHVGTQELHELFSEPSQCIWLVPGTFDEDGRNVE
jgi:hypothetical protein